MAIEITKRIGVTHADSHVLSTEIEYSTTGAFAGEQLAIPIEGAPEEWVISQPTGTTLHVRARDLNAITPSAWSTPITLTFGTVGDDDFDPGSDVVQGGYNGFIGLDSDGFTLFGGAWGTKDIIFTEQDPTTNYISWTAGWMIDGRTGTKYPIDAGSTRLNYVWWDIGNTAFTAFNFLPVLIRIRMMVAKNVAGVPYDMLNNTFNHPDLIQPGTIKPSRTAQNTQVAILNPGYEINSDEDETMPDSWTVSGADFALDTTVFASGSKSFKMWKASVGIYAHVLWINQNRALLSADKSLLRFFLFAED